MSLRENTQHVSGVKKGKVMLYALSTCPWCRKTKALLNNLRVDYTYVDVDLLSSDDREEALEEVRKWNPPCSFPTLVINDNKCIVGFKEDETREALSGGK